MDVQSYAPGSFCWYELTTSDGPGAEAFYTSLFGWEAVDNPVGESTVYTMLLKGGKSVSALFECHDHEIPPHWGVYVSVANVDATAANAESLGGKVLMAPMDVMTVGRMAVIQDPTGAALCLWQPRAHIGARVVDEVGAFCWVELMTTDVRAAAQFYNALFGWQAKGEPGVADYIEWQNGGRSIAGMMALPAEARAMGAPSNWLPYVQVADCDATASAAQSAGAGLYHPPTDIPGVGRFAVLRDPQGVAIAVVQLR
jgi:uncharacterized protein